MSQLPLNHHRKPLDIIRCVGGSAREPMVRMSFHDLRKAWGKLQSLISWLNTGSKWR